MGAEALSISLHGKLKFIRSVYSSHVYSSHVYCSHVYSFSFSHVSRLDAHRDRLGKIPISSVVLSTTRSIAIAKDL